MGSSRRRPRTSWSVLGRLGASSGRLGSFLEVSCTRCSIQRVVSFRSVLFHVIFQLIVGVFRLPKSIPEIPLETSSFFSFQVLQG